MRLIAFAFWFECREETRSTTVRGPGAGFIQVVGSATNEPFRIVFSSSQMKRIFDEG
jgi:hypothetical protein